MPRQKGRQDKQDLHIYIDQDLFERFRAARLALEPAAPSQNAVIAWMIRTWTENQEQAQRRAANDRTA